MAQAYILGEFRQRRTHVPRIAILLIFSVVCAVSTMVRVVDDKAHCTLAASQRSIRRRSVLVRASTTELGGHLIIYGCDVAPETIKVPQMAESITEGTLKQWSKQVGDFVAADEEVATIETDKVSRVPFRFINQTNANRFRLTFRSTRQWQARLSNSWPRRRIP